jgi:hypothetical protein
LTPSRSRAEVGQPLTIEAEVQSGRSLSAPQMEATVTAPDGRHLPLVFTPDLANPRRYRATFACQRAGVHRIAASVQTGGQTMAENATIVQIDELRGDAAPIDAANLARIAQATGGKWIDPGRPETWPAPPEAELPTIAQSRTLDLWNNFTLLFVLCGLLGADWFIRLSKGLVS